MSSSSYTPVNPLQMFFGHEHVQPFYKASIATNGTVTTLDASGSTVQTFKPNGLVMVSFS